MDNQEPLAHKAHAEEKTQMSNIDTTQKTGVNLWALEELTCSCFLSDTCNVTYIVKSCRTPLYATMRSKTNNTNKTCALLQAVGNKDEDNIKLNC